MTGKLIVAVAAVLLATGSLAHLFFGDTWVSQERNLRKARAHLPAVAQAITASSEFAHVTAGVGTGAGGCILVSGRVVSKSDLESLRQCIASTQPPVAVTYSVSISKE